MFSESSATALAPKYTVRMMEGLFSQEVFEESKLPILEIPSNEKRYAQGLWVPIEFNTETKKLKAVSPPYDHGAALAY
ncbi:MAG: hypothetical protein R2785_00865 [Flavobacteriaceae bacterium]